MLEVELKVAVSLEDLAKLRRHAAIVAQAISRAASRKQYSVYYDTGKRDLQSHEIALRLRKAANGWTQTIKVAGQNIGGLGFRPEYAAPTPAQLINWTALEETPVAAVFADADVRHDLQPVFITDFRRTSREVRIGDDDIAEIAFDHGLIRAGIREEAICEIELELKSGNALQLIAFAKRLFQGSGSARIETRSKAERGYALAANDGRTPRKAQAIRVHADQSVSDVFATIAAACLNHFQANRDGVIHSDDIEYVHQARVAIRRLRSCFTVFRDVVTKSTAEATLLPWRALAERLGTVRDLDVLTHDTLPSLQHEIPVDEDLSALTASFEAQRLRAREALQAQLRESGQMTLELDLAAALIAQPWQHEWDERARALASMPVKDFAMRVLRRQFKRLRRRARQIDSRQLETVHAFRIQMKKLRYAIEFFNPLFPSKDTEYWLSRAADLQDVLGRINDHAVLLERLQAIESIESNQAMRQQAFLRGFIAGHFTGELNRLMRSWSRMESGEVFWRETRKSRH